MIRQLLPLATAVLTVAAMWRAGSGRRDAWTIALANQVLWAATIVVFDVWGLAPLTVILTVTYTRNWLAWRPLPAVEVEAPSAVEELLEAIRLTQEYAQLPALDGWSWWDVYRKHRPDDADRLYEEWLRSEPAQHRRARTQEPPAPRGAAGWRGGRS